MSYNYKEIEKKWQNKWEKEGTFYAENNSSKKKWYGLIEFPYPSGQGLHVGHPRSYTAMDIVARKRRMQGYNVLFPIGFDAFGLPAENFAIKNHIHPKIVTEQNIANFTRQLKSIGFSFDWSRVINTTDPEYYKWTQWIFIQLYKHGLAYKATMPINFCTGCKVGLSNEEVVNGVCERCGSPVVQKEKSQWMLKITDYAQRLIDDLDDVDFLEKIKIQQRNWIGRSEGAELDFSIADSDEKLRVYTTRPDTLFGATYMVVAPEHHIIEKLKDKITNLDEIKAYQTAASLKSDFERSEINKDKTGVEIKGIKAINPLTNKEIPIWISDYVLSSYGTGAIMAVPAHDSRDFEFATKFNLPIVQVVTSNDDVKVDLSKEAFTDVATGILINSGFLDGLSVTDAKSKVIKYLEDNKIGSKKVNYKLRDWVFSRQRYWGEPIPMVYCECCGWQPIDEKDLPLTLPEIDDFKPGENGESPLAKLDSWINTTCPKCGKPAKRETNTMPQWAGSSWYFLRYVDNKNEKELVSREKADKYLPVDMYIGGVEHAVLHLLYSRFYTKFLCDIGVIDFDEPFHKLFNQGMITGKNGIKMSKSKGNVISPDDLVRDYGCDSLRLYELFVGPPELDSEWDDRGIDGVYRFITRFWKLILDNKDADVKETKELVKVRNKLIYDITTRLESFSLNTVISGFMEYNNKLIDMAKKGGVDKKTLETFVILMAPFAPHISEELWSQLGHEDSVFHETWPAYDENAMKDDEKELAVQINGKTKCVVTLPADVSKEDAIAAGKAALGDKLTGNVIKEIYVPGRIINIVAK